MSGFHPKDLINEVKIRPGIYNKDLLEHPQRENKRRLWLEVAERLTPDDEWDSYTDVEKDVRVGEISTKWKNLKDHFYREIKLHEAGEANKKRKYIYFDDMEFVRPFVGYKVMSLNKNVNKTNNSDSLDETTEYVVSETDIDMQALLDCGDNIVEEDVDGTKVTVVEVRPETKRVIKPTYKVLANRPATSAPLANSLLNKEPVIKNFDVLKKTGCASSSNYKIRDGDITFCLSLVPTLRKLSDAHKLKAKIEILKVLHFYVENVERHNLTNQANVSSNYNRTTTSFDSTHCTDNDDEEEHLDEEHLEDFEGVVVKREHYDPLNGGEGGGSGSGNTKVWWT